MAVSILSLLMGPDKEAVMVWISIGCYPMLKPIFEKKLLGVLLKLVFFNVTILLAYGILVYLMGLQEVAAESMEFGLIGLAIILILGNGAFLLLDRLLTIMNMRFRS